MAEFIRQARWGLLFVDPARFAKLVSVYEKTGVLSWLG